jgi:outer membrane protein
MKYALGLVLCGVGWAQGTVQLTLAKAVEIAQSPDGSTKIALAEQTIARAETQVLQAKATLLPSVDGATSVRNQTTNLRTFGFNFSAPGFVIPSKVGPFTVIDMRPTVRYTVLDLANRRRLDVTKAGVDTGKADLEVARAQVSEVVARSYLAALRAEASLKATQTNVDLSKALVALAQSQKDAGSGTGIEVTRAQVQLANNEGRLIVAQNDRNRAVLQLLRSMGLDLSVQVTLAGALDFVPQSNRTAAAEIARAREGRMELRAQKQRETVARLNTVAVEAERLPTISSFADYGGIGQPQIGLAATHTAGVTVNVPIFDGGRRAARRMETNTAARTEQLRTRDLEQQIELEVRLGLESLRSAETQVTTAREGLRLAQNEVEQAQRRYQAGVGVPLEVTDAQARLDRARDTEIQALYAYNMARLEVAVATGHIQEFIQ